MSRTCTTEDCTRPTHGRGLCHRHYEADRRAAKRQAQTESQQAAKQVRRSDQCDRLDCPRTATHLLTLPAPIRRREQACQRHADHLRAARLPGLRIEQVAGER